MSYKLILTIKRRILEEIKKLAYVEGEEVAVTIPEDMPTRVIQKILTDSFVDNCKDNTNCETIHFFAIFISLGGNFHLNYVPHTRDGWTINEYEHYLDMMVQFSFKIEELRNPDKVV